MKEQITFNVVMPCYNSEEYVCDAIESVLRQTYPNWSLIVVNDGSTDGTLQILENYAQKDHRIKVFSKENGGYATAINTGLDHLTGDYFMMMGSDDQLFSDLFSKIAKEIEEELPDMIAFRTVKFIGGEAQGVDDTTDFDTKKSAYHITIKEYHDLYPLHSKILFERDTSKCYKRAILGDLRLFGKYGYDADGIFATLFAHRARSFMSIPVDGYRWMLREGSVSASTNLPKNLDRLSNWKQFFEISARLPKEEITEYEIGYAKAFYHIARKTAQMIPANEKKSFKVLRQNTKDLPSIYRRYGIFIGWKEKVSMVFWIKFPRIWAQRMKHRNDQK